MKIALGLEYDGSQFCGWQSQRGVRTVQDSLECALSTVADHAVKTICAGRTDTGVHALEQVIHFETQAERAMRSWVLGANAKLPPDISVQWARPMSDDFHARFSARSRRYRYVILDHWVRPAVLRSKVTWEHQALDVSAMQAGAEHLLGEHDFSTFRALACQASSPIRTVYDIAVARQGAYIYIDVHANAFLHHMVRNIVGVLTAVGKGEQSPKWVRELLGRRDRTQGGVTAPPDGLYLVKVHYEAGYGLPGAVSLPSY